MNPTTGLGHDFDGPAAYQITVRGVIAVEWSGRLEGMSINRLTLDDGTIFTVLTGALTDQAALSGVLNTLYELQLPLIAVNKLPLAPRDSNRHPPAGADGGPPENIGGFT